LRFCVSLPFVFVCLPAYADLISIGAAKDNTLYQDDFGSISNGAGDFFFAGVNGNGAVRRGLIAFDLGGSIPAGATIQSVELTLHMSRTATAVEPIELHRVFADWGEGASDAFNEEGTGANAESGDATWLHTFYDANSWTNPGGDFEPAASATRFVGGNGPYTWTSAAMNAEVQDWLDHPGSNFGWIVIGDEAVSMTAKRFDSRENSDPLVRPVLTVEYAPIPEPHSVLLCFLLLCLRRRRSLAAKWPSVAKHRPG